MSTARAEARTTNVSGPAATGGTTTSPATGAGHVVWLVRLRWVACAGQLATIACADVLFDVRLPIAELLATVAVVAFSNALLLVGWRRHTRSSHAAPAGSARPAGIVERLLPGVMALDVVALTALLYLTGGPTNPFIVFYFVNLALAAVILPARWAWALLGVALLGMAGLFVAHVPLRELEQSRPLAGWWAAPAVRLQYQGLFVALAGCASVVVYFITYVARELRRREAELRAADRQRWRGQRLEALATLAAGAAHELATPLATIAVVAKELTRHLENVRVPETVRDDVALIRGELDRCRTILDRMSASAGQAVGEEVALVGAAQLTEAILTDVRRRDRVAVSVAAEAQPLRARVPLQALAQALRGLVRNALDATDAASDGARHLAAPAGHVRLDVAREPGSLRFEVSDSGPGMPPDVLARAGEPFFTTKEPGRGMGLGLFLCRSVVERLGGSLELRSPPGQGVTAIVRLPADDLPADEM
jgi:two-component system sensor histidine kinase RegB